MIVFRGGLKKKPDDATDKKCRFEYSMKNKANLELGLINSNGYTLIELLVVICIISIILSLSGLYIIQAKKMAYAITAKYDLHQFAKIEEDHYVQHEKFIGRTGQSIRNDGQASDFNLKGFYPTSGVCITIVSGSPEDPFKTGNPFVAQSRHNGVDRFYEFNFKTRELAEK